MDAFTFFAQCPLPVEIAPFLIKLRPLLIPAHVKMLVY